MAYTNSLNSYCKLTRILNANTQFISHAFVIPYAGLEEKVH